MSVRDDVVGIIAREEGADIDNDLDCSDDAINDTDLLAVLLLLLFAAEAHADVVRLDLLPADEGISERL